MSINRLMLLLLCFLLNAGVTQAQEAGAKGTEHKSTHSAKTAPLRMKQNKDGKWVIVNRKKQTLYEVFPYDNGPDYRSITELQQISYLIVFKRVMNYLLCSACLQFEGITKAKMLTFFR